MGERYFQVDLSTNPDFVKLAASFGIPAWRVTKREEVSGAIEKAIAVEGPALLEFLISREENVYPMIPPDGSIEEIILGEG